MSPVEPVTEALRPPAPRSGHQAFAALVAALGIPNASSCYEYLEQGETDYFVMIADQTTDRETFGAGRYLYVSPPDASGKVVLDFNKAENPPCAFTPFATCPLPPPENSLDFEIKAGEKRYDH